MISQIAPQSAKTSAGQQTQDGSGFAALLDVAVDENQTQATENAEMQTTEQKTTDGEKSAGDIAAEIMASLINSAIPMVQQDATTAKNLAVQTDGGGGVGTEVIADATKPAGQLSGLAATQVVTGLDVSSESLTDAVADTSEVLGESSIESTEMEALGMEASSNVEMPITESDGILKPIMMQGVSPAITAAGDNFATDESPGKEADDSVSKSLEAIARQSENAEQTTKQIDNKATQKNGLLAGADTKIEVAAEPSREFTIKPQVVNPVKSDAGAFSSNQVNAVTEISSTDVADLGTDTSGSQNAYQSAASLATDSTVKQTNQTQAAQSTSQIDDSVHTRIIDQIVKEVKMIKLPQRTDLVVRLTPPELGSLRVQISQSANGMTAQIETSGDQVKSLLQAHLTALNQAFSDAGLKMDSVSVSSGTSFGSLMQDTAQGSAQQQYSGQRRYYGSSQDSGGSQNMINMPINSAAVDMNQGYSWLA